jgi:hypothetical protein
MNRKVFQNLYNAQEFAKTINGKITERALPNYNYVEWIYIVEW